MYIIAGPVSYTHLAKIKMESMFKYIVPYFIIGTITLFVITYVPAISLVFVN